MNRTITLKILLAQKSSFLALFSAQYPLSRRLLELGKLYWDWDALSGNRVLSWDIDLLKKYQGRWNRSEGQGLQTNPALPWATEIIKHVVGPGVWKWLEVPDREKVMSDTQLMALCLSHWNEECHLFKSPPMYSYRPLSCSFWGKGTLSPIHAATQSGKTFAWDQFSEVTRFPWTSEIIEKHGSNKDRINQAGNGAVPWTSEFIGEFWDRWEWSLMSPDISWNDEVIAAFEDKWNWRLLSREGKVPWTEKMLIRFADKVWWAIPDITDCEWQGTVSGIINWQGFCWTPKLYEALHSDIERHFEYLVEKYAQNGVVFISPDNKKLNWTYFCNTGNWSPAFLKFLQGLECDKGIPFINWGQLCNNGKRLWTDTFIRENRTQIEANILCLCRNPHFPWMEYIAAFAPMLPPCGWSELSRRQDLDFTVDFISRYLEKWDWMFLSANPRLTPDLISAFPDKLNWQSLATNPSLTMQLIYKYEARWDPISWRRMSRLPCVDMETIDKSLPWDWVELLRWQVTQDKGRLTDYVDETLLEAFLKALSGGG